MAIKIILILALLQYIYYFIFKPKLNILSCGIFGQATNTPVKLDVSSVNILGIYNIERGKQSCGLTWDGDIQHGIDKDKLYSDFIKNRNIKPKYFPTMFGHTRQSSYGNIVNLDNAHPFGYGISADKNSYEFIFVHNGTLKNSKELAAKYNIDTIVKYQKKMHNSENTYETTRTKIDSEILGEILWQEKSYHVLSEYVGTAACAWMWCNEPNKLYLWSGASKLHIDDTDGKIFEERPLCVYNKSKNNMFFSSLEDSLTTIGGVLNNNIEQIAVNKVHIITNGDYKNCEKILCTRKNACQDDSYKAPRHNHYGGNHRTQNYYDTMLNGCIDYSNPSSAYCNVKNVTGMDITEDIPLHNINNYLGKVYSKGLRYWKNGHVINGIYMYILGYGFKRLGDSYVEAYAEIEKNRGKVFSTGGDFSYTITEGQIPIQKESKIQLHYFIDGAMLKTHSDYIKCQEMKKNMTSGTKYIGVVELSSMSKHPVATMLTSKKPPVYLDGGYYTGNCVELGFEKVYYFDNGKFMKCSKRLDLTEKKPVIQLPINFKKEEPQIVHNPQILNQAVNNIRNYEKEWEDDLKKETSNKIIETHFETEIDEELNEEDVDEFITDFVSESFISLIEDIESKMKDLKDYKENSIAKDAIRTFDMILNVCNQYITEPEK